MMRDKYAVCAQFPYLHETNYESTGLIVDTQFARIINLYLTTQLMVIVLRISYHAFIW